jgi:hypothetical protein
MPAAFDAGRLATLAGFMADPAREGRGLGSVGLEAATAWVEQAMRDGGLKPAGETGFRQSFLWHGGSPASDLTLTNLVGRIPGSDKTLADHPVLLLAHLDHLGQGWPDVRAGNAGLVHPGADDNASGVAVLLELAAALAAEPRPARPILVAITTGEEAGLVGSRHMLGAMAADRLPVVCLCLDTVGRLRDGRLYAIDTQSARELPFILMGAAATVGVPLQIAAERLDSSDQAACLERGVPGVQLFAGPTPDYHRPGDTADKLDAAGMGKIAELAHEVVTYLAGRVEPLHATPLSGAATPGSVASGANGARASLGTMPDFAFSGPGIRVAQVMPGSAAEKAGLAPGDVLLALGENRLAGLRDLAAVLKAHQAGDKVVVALRRNGQELRIPVTLQAR